MDDMGLFYGSHAELLQAQGDGRTEFYAANAKFWEDGGCGGKTDDETMVGDGGSIADGEDGLLFLDSLLQNDGDMKCGLALDVGAGVGRVTKLVLLKRYTSVHLVEGNDGISKRSRIYLGKKRAARCAFTSCYLQDLDCTLWSEEPVDLMWIQWTLQYLTDVDAVECLQKLLPCLRVHVGVIVVKENRPFGTAREDRFQMDTPDGPNRRYDITRSDAHHRCLFEEAGFRVDAFEKGEETHTYALKVV